MDGEAFLKELRAMSIKVPILLITGEFFTAKKENVFRDLCYDIIFKPYKTCDLEKTLKKYGRQNENYR